MNWPWEKPPEFNYIQYIQFMDTHSRVSVFINDTLIGTFAVLDEGNLTGSVETVMPDGKSLVLKMEGHPRTTDPRMTATELVSYVLEHYK